MNGSPRPAREESVMAEEEHVYGVPRLLPVYRWLQELGVICGAYTRVLMADDPAGSLSQYKPPEFDVGNLPLPIIQKDIHFQIPVLEGVRVQRLDDFTIRVLNNWDELTKEAWARVPVVYEEPQPDVVVERKGE
jgi:hypothetical protein